MLLFFHCNTRQHNKEIPENAVDLTLTFSLHTILMYYFYVIQNEMTQLYFGSTNNLKRRLTEHQSDKSFATKGHHWKLIYYEAYYAESDAREREYQIKNNTGSKKHLLNRIARSRL